MPADALTPLSLLPRWERDYRERVARRRTQQLAVAAGAIWLVAGALFVGRLMWERRAIERELAALAQPLAAVLDARRELHDAQTTVAAVTAAEWERGRSLTVVTAITRALPDSSVLTSLAWSADGTGVSRFAGPLVPEAAPFNRLRIEYVMGAPRPRGEWLLPGNAAPELR